MVITNGFGSLSLSFWALVSRSKRAALQKMQETLFPTRGGLIRTSKAFNAASQLKRFRWNRSVVWQKGG